MLKERAAEKFIIDEPYTNHSKREFTFDQVETVYMERENARKEFFTYRKEHPNL